MIVSLDYSIMVIELVCIECLYNAVSHLQFFNRMLTHFELLLATGSIRNTTFSNIVIDTYYYDPSWWGNSEPMYVAACPRDPLTKVTFPTHTNSYFRIEPNEFPARVSSWCTRPNDNKVNQVANHTFECFKSCRISCCTFLSQKHWTHHLKRDI